MRSLRHTPRRRGEWIDRFLGSDPGLNRLRNALHSVVTIAVSIEAERLFVHFSGALPSVVAGRSPAAAHAAVTNHEFLVIAMVLGGLVGLLSTFAVTDPGAKGQLVSVLSTPIALIPGLAVGLALGDHRVASLILITVVPAFGTYLRRFGPRGALVGMMLFLGDFLGFFLRKAFSLSDLGWFIAEIGVGLFVALGIRFIFFFPRPQKALERTQRSYDARARKVANFALELFDNRDHPERDRRRLHHQLVRLNESALMIDAQLGNPTAVSEGSCGQLLHQRLFDVELALSNISRFAAAMTRIDLPAHQRSEIRLALLDITRNDAESARAHAENLLGLLRGSERAPVVEDEADPFVLVHRFAESVIIFTMSMTDWTALGRSDGDRVKFRSSVVLVGGWLPGAAQVSAKTSLESGGGDSERIRLTPYTRAAIQMGVAVGAATLLGVQISGYRFYWAVIAAFISFMGTSNTGEQVVRACYRVAGTVVGIGIGSLLIDAVGHNAYLSCAVILIALFFGLYFMRISYAFFVVGVTVMVAQLYEQLGEFSNSLLLLRLAETAVGSAVAIVVVITVFPLHTRRVLRIALRAHVQAIGHLAEHATAGLLGRELDEYTLRADARAVDATYQALDATARPLRRNLLGQLDENVQQALRLAAAIRHYARNLVVDVANAGPLTIDVRPDLERACMTLHTSVGILAEALSRPSDATYARSAALFDRVERRIEDTELVGADELALSDLMLIDGTLAQMAEGIGLQVTDHDTGCAA
jgi:uncharacterized membrane protein YgaE (UPF0421/DUF939 family)